MSTACGATRLSSASERGGEAARNLDARRPPALAQDASCGAKLVGQDVPFAVHSKSTGLSICRPQTELPCCSPCARQHLLHCLQRFVGHRAGLVRTVAFFLRATAIIGSVATTQLLHPLSHRLAALLQVSPRPAHTR
uniref:Uncharacterized protein n=1 Tax=Haptolina ericina TaxID=156174 RepID=A0A7S3F4K1_9EUKA